MAKPKRSYKIKRAKRFSLKNVSTITATRFKDQIERLVELLRIWLIIQDNSEKESLAIMDSLGVPPEKRAYYLAHTKQQIKTALHFEIETMLKEMGINIDIWTKRGLVEIVLNELKQPQEKWGSIYSYLLTILKNSYMDYSFIDYCRVW